ncbi:MAG: hypothetical protein QOE73_643 [Verrucomicrobiota bacterium]
MAFEKGKLKHVSVLPDKLLRSAGQSLRQEYDRLFDERFIAYFVVVVAFWLVCIVAWVQKFAGLTPGPSFWTLLSLCVTAYGGFQAFRLRPQLRHLRFGEAGERRFAEALDRIRAKGFAVFHNVPANGFNIGYVVVGFSGVYAIETKTRHGADTIHYQNDNELLLGGKINDSPALRQARGSAYAIHAQLKEHLHEAYWVKPVLVFVGSRRVRQPAGDYSVDVITADGLENYLDRQKPELTSIAVTDICSHLERSAQS